MNYYDRWEQILPFPGWTIDCGVGLAPRDWDHSSHLYLQDKELGFFWLPLTDKQIFNNSQISLIA